MKFQLLHISLLVTLLFSLTFNVATSEPVYDIDGNALMGGEQYYILPVFRGRGGGLTLAQHGNLCPLYVAQEDSEVENGLPLIFHPVNAKMKPIKLSGDMNIQFSAITICMQSLVWRLGDAEGADNKRYVITDGSIGNPGKETVSNWFKIEKCGDKDYKLVFCPSVCKTCKVVCGDLGVFYEDGKWFLGLNGDVPFPVMFKKTAGDSEFQ